MYVSAPGSNAVFEGLFCGVDMVFLPPQNATQVAQLACYEEAGLVPPGLNLAALDPEFPPAALTADEATFTESVLASLARIDNADIRERVAAHVREQIETLSSRNKNREEFRALLGEPGGAKVAQEITTWWSERWM